MLLILHGKNDMILIIKKYQILKYDKISQKYLILKAKKKIQLKKKNIKEKENKIINDINQIQSQKIFKVKLL